MKLKPLFLSASLLAAGVIACNQVVNHHLKINLTRLSKDNIYDKKLVSDVVFDAHELKIDSLKDKSAKLFLKGVDLYKNKKNPVGAIEAFKQSLLVFPQVETYYEIGQAMMTLQETQQGQAKRQSLREALQAYQVAEHLNYQPASFLYYNMACAENLLGNDTIGTLDRPTIRMNGAIADLRNAFANGFSDTNMLKKDTRLKDLYGSDSYKQMIAELNTQKKSDRPQTLFDLYKAMFPMLPQPFTIGAGQVGMDDYKTQIDFQFAKFIPEMENTQFGRDVSHDYYVVGKVMETPLFTAIIYTSTEFEGPMEPVYTKLVTYNADGNMIDSRLISCRCTPEKAKAVKIENNTITTEEFKVEWKYSAEDYDHSADNVIVKKESLGKSIYKFNEIGKIVDAADSAKVAFR